jgi:soluble lytic murein transglycosylase-like protein
MGCPGSASYRILGNGIVEVNGSVPTFPAAADAERRLLKAWDRYGSAIQGAALRHNLPPSWLLAILMQESNGGARDCSPCSSTCCSTHLGRTCCAFSIMQFQPASAEAQGVTIEQMMQDETLAISIGGQLLRRLLDRYEGDFVKAAVSYNAGSLRCGYSTTFGYYTEGNYALDVVKWSNTAIRAGLPSASVNIASTLILAASALAAVAIYTGYWSPKWI